MREAKTEAWESRSAEVEKRRTTTLAPAAASVPGCAEQLARFFPEAEAVRVRAVLTPFRSSVSGVCETVLVEFASADKAIFNSALPLEFDDRVRLKDAEGSGESLARVVAVQYHEGHKAVAVQFVNGPCSWVKRP